MFDLIVQTDVFTVLTLFDYWINVFLLYNVSLDINEIAEMNPCYLTFGCYYPYLHWYSEYSLFILYWKLFSLIQKDFLCIRHNHK